MSALFSRRGWSVVAAAGFALAALASGAAGGEVGASGDIGIKGYDPVSYFTDRKAVHGSAAYSYRWLGATWLFASDEHRRLFAATPVAYAPQYGGACAESMATTGEAVLYVDPESWQIVDGKLYLSGEPHFQERSLDVVAADRNWRALNSKSK